jgi:hypothetical protein
MMDLQIAGSIPSGLLPLRVSSQRERPGNGPAFGCKTTHKRSVLPAFPPRFRRALWIVAEVTAALLTTLSAGHDSKFVIARETSLMCRHARATFARDLALTLPIHRSKPALRCSVLFHYAEFLSLLALVWMNLERRGLGPPQAPLSTAWATICPKTGSEPFCSA